MGFYYEVWGNDNRRLETEGGETGEFEIRQGLDERQGYLTDNTCKYLYLGQWYTGKH